MARAMRLSAKGSGNDGKSHEQSVRNQRNWIWNFVRSQFPAFAVPGLRDQAFFENAGGSYACAPVIDRLTRFYRERKVQPYGPYAASSAGGDEMDEARTRLAAMLGVAVDEVSFGPSTTANTYVLAQAFRQRAGTRQRDCRDKSGP